MRFRFTMVWVATTAAGMAISWAGVGHALRGTTLPNPDLAANVPVERGRPPAPPASSPDPSASPSTRRPSSPASSPSGGSTAKASPTTSPTPGTSGKVRTYVVKSGRVVLSVGTSSARLVSAVPDSGFQVKTWRKDGWLRVDLTDGEHGSAVFATWNGHPTLVQVYEY